MWGITEAVQSNNLLSIWSCLTSGIIDTSSLFHLSIVPLWLPENFLSFAGHLEHCWTFADFRRTFSRTLQLPALFIPRHFENLLNMSGMSDEFQEAWVLLPDVTFPGHMKQHCWTFEDFRWTVNLTAAHRETFCLRWTFWKFALHVRHGQRISESMCTPASSLCVLLPDVGKLQFGFWMDTTTTTTSVQ